MALELALRVDNKETAVPKPYPDTLQPNDYRPEPDPARRATKTHDSERGPRARKAGHQPTGAAPATGLTGAEGAQLGVYESTTKGRLNPADSDRRLPPDHPGSQSDAAAARRMGAGDGRREDRECASEPRGPLPHEDVPARKLLLSVPLTTTPTRRPRLIDSDSMWRLPPDLSSASSQRPSARLTARNYDSEGCRTQEALTQPRLLLLKDTPARKVPSWIRH